MYDKLMVAFDGTAPSRRALYAGVELAERLHRPLRTITVLENDPITLAAGGSSPETMPEVRRSAEEFAKDLIDEATTLGRAQGVEVSTESVYGQEVDGILGAVDRYGIDTLIVGIHAHPGLLDRLMSHTGRDLTERSPCSVLGVK